MELEGPVTATLLDEEVTSSCCSALLLSCCQEQISKEKQVESFAGTFSVSVSSLC